MFLKTNSEPFLLGRLLLPDNESGNSCICPNPPVVIHQKTVFFLITRRFSRKDPLMRNQGALSPYQVLLGGRHWDKSLKLSDLSVLVCEQELCPVRFETLFSFKNPTSAIIVGEQTLLRKLIPLRNVSAPPHPPRVPSGLEREELTPVRSEPPCGRSQRPPSCSGIGDSPAGSSPPGQARDAGSPRVPA